MRQPLPTRREAAAACRPAGDGDVLADAVVVADLKPGRFAGVLQVLRGDAEAGEGEDAVPVAEGQVSVEDDVRDQLAVFAEHDIRADGAVRADRAGRRYDGSCGDDCGRVDAHSAGTSGVGFLGPRGTSWHITVASQATLPSTVATPSILTARLRHCSTVTSIRN